MMAPRAFVRPGRVWGKRDGVERSRKDGQRSPPASCDVLVQRRREDDFAPDDGQTTEGHSAVRGVRKMDVFCVV